VKQVAGAWRIGQGRYQLAVLGAPEDLAALCGLDPLTDGLVADTLDASAALELGARS
jgi:hypothetical protein